MTSHDVVQIVRRGTGIRRIGHIGTLDPRASGVLVLLVGPAVRLSEYLITDRKRYEAQFTFGAVSNTYDADGEVVKTGGAPELDEESVSAAMKQFTGEIVQRPPNYSALKIGGKRRTSVRAPAKFSRFRSGALRFTLSTWLSLIRRIFPSKSTVHRGRISDR